MKNCFIRGSVVRYVQIPADAVDTQLLEDATRRGPRFSPMVFGFPDRDRYYRGPQPDQTVKLPRTSGMPKGIVLFRSTIIPALCFFLCVKPKQRTQWDKHMGITTTVGLLN